MHGPLENRQDSFISPVGSQVSGSYTTQPSGSLVLGLSTWHISFLPSTLAEEA